MGEIYPNIISGQVEVMENNKTEQMKKLLILATVFTAIISFGTTPVFDDLNDDWLIVEKTNTSIKLKEDNPAQPFSRNHFELRLCYFIFAIHTGSGFVYCSSPS